MLKPTEDIGNRLTLAYRGYDLELTRAVSGWLVGMYPRSAERDRIARDERDTDSPGYEREDKPQPVKAAA
jgi:hypothetical protein